MQNITRNIAALYGKLMPVLLCVFVAELLHIHNYYINFMNRNERDIRQHIPHSQSVHFSRLTRLANSVAKTTHVSEYATL